MVTEWLRSITCAVKLLEGIVYDLDGEAARVL